MNKDYLGQIVKVKMDRPLGIGSAKNVRRPLWENIIWL